MVGYSKWPKVKHTKDLLDVKRGVVFSKLVKETPVVARIGGGGSLSGNSRRHSRVDLARAANLPKENVERAIKKGSGELAGAHHEETSHESYEPGGVAMVSEAATDNKNRTAGDPRLIFSKNGGRLAAGGSVLYQLHKKERITVSRPLAGGDRIFELTLAAKAGEISTRDTGYVVFTPPDKTCAVVEALRQEGAAAETQKQRTYRTAPSSSITGGLPLGGSSCTRRSTPMTTL